MIDLVVTRMLRNFAFMKECLQCKKEFQEKRESAKFCSDKCRVKWNRKNGGQQIKKWQAQSILNQINEAMDKLNQRIQNLTEPTHQIKPITDVPKQSNVVFNVQVPNKPVLSGFEAYKEEILATTWSGDLEKLMRRIKADTSIAQWQYRVLENLAKEHAKTFTN